VHIEEQQRTDGAGSASDTILRFRPSERWVHWSIAIPFLICFTTALILVVAYNPDPSRPYRALFSWAHRVSGVALIAMPLVAAIRGRSEWRIHLENIKQAWGWTIDDLKWLALMGLAAVNPKIKLPDQGKFNAAEKLNFMMVMCTWPLFAITGVLIWLPGIAFASWVAHFALALMAAPLMMGHIFMATVNPSTRIGLPGMISGFVNRDWAMHHYTRWYRENFGPREPVTVTEECPTSPAPTGLPIRCPCCGSGQVVASWSLLLDHVLEGAPLKCDACGVDMSSVSVYADPTKVDIGTLVARLDQRAPQFDQGNRLPPAV
jgi:formate dehydrogenase subunit gamma